VEADVPELLAKMINPSKGLAQPITNDLMSLTHAARLICPFFHMLSLEEPVTKCKCISHVD
jgi:hypothetical protein